ESIGNRKNREKFNEIRQRRGILKRMGTIGVEEAAAVRTPFLDDLLGSHGTLRNPLLSNRVHHRFAARTNHWLAIRADLLHLLRFNQLDGVIGPEVLHNTL